MPTVRIERKLAKQCCLLLFCKKYLAPVVPRVLSSRSITIQQIEQCANTIYPVDSTMIQPLSDWNLKDNRQQWPSFAAKICKGTIVQKSPCYCYFVHVLSLHVGDLRAESFSQGQVFHLKQCIYTSITDTMQIYFIACVLLFCTKITYKMYLKSIFTVMGVKVTPWIGTSQNANTSEPHSCHQQPAGHKNLAVIMGWP